MRHSFRWKEPDVWNNKTCSNHSSYDLTNTQFGVATEAEGNRTVQFTLKPVFRSCGPNAKRRMRPMKLLQAFVLFALFATVLSAADVAGQWMGRIVSREGGTRTVYFVFQTEGNRLTGAMTDAHGDNPISDGKIAGNVVSFTINYSLSGTPVKRIYRGTFEGDALRMTYQSEDGETRREFVINRMK
jgi:hypothetical protein